MGRKIGEEEEKFYAGKFKTASGRHVIPGLSSYVGTHEREASHIFFQQCKEA